MLSSLKWNDSLSTLSSLALSWPLAILFFSLYADNKELIISGALYNTQTKLLFIIIILICIFLNVLSIYFKKDYRLCHIISGLFLLTAGIIHFHRLFNCSCFSIFGSEINPGVSYWAAALLIPLGLMNIITAFHLHYNPVSIGKDNSFDILKRISGFKEKINKPEVSPYSAIILGLGAAFFIAIPFMALAFLVEVILRELFYSRELKEIVWVGIVGAQGSIVSILLRMRRLKEYVVRKSKEPNFNLFTNALFRPYIGMSLAHLSYFMLESGIIGINTDIPYVDTNAHVMVAFLTGFTERIGGDYLERSQKELESINP